VPRPARQIIVCGARDGRDRRRRVAGPEAGNAYAHQRVAQNAADSVANAGATIIGERLGGAARFDADIKAAMDSMSTANDLDGYGRLPRTSSATAERRRQRRRRRGAAERSGRPTAARSRPTPGRADVGQPGVRHDLRAGARDRPVPLSAGRDAGVAGALSGGRFFPVVFPVSMAGCDGTDRSRWTPVAAGQPGTPHPDGQEWMIPLCKSGDGSFMILDLTRTRRATRRVLNPSSIQFNDFPVDVHVEVGNDCAKKIEEATIDGSLQGTVIFIPICDNACTTESGTGGSYHIIRITAFWLDYISYSNEPNNSECARTTSPTFGTSIVNIVGGNGSASCMAGWFVRYVTSGPVGSGAIFDGEAIGVQLIR
jgi:hypothetical protein